MILRYISSFLFMNLLLFHFSMGQTNTVESQVDSAKAYFNQGKYESSLSALDRAIDMNGSSNAEIILWQAKSYLELGQKNKIDQLLLSFYAFPVSDKQKKAMDDLVKDMLSREPSDIEPEPDVKAEFPGGQKAYFKYMKKNLNFSKGATRGINENIKASFIVLEDGSISHVKIVEGRYPKLNAEYLKFIQSMPNFVPAQKNGKPVKSKMNMAIRLKNK